MISTQLRSRNKKKSASVILLIRPRSSILKRLMSYPHPRQPTVRFFNRKASERSSMKIPRNSTRSCQMLTDFGKKAAKKAKYSSRSEFAVRTLRGNRPRARAFQSRCPLHRKRESQHRVSGCETSRSQLRTLGHEGPNFPAICRSDAWAYRTNKTRNCCSSRAGFATYSNQVSAPSLKPIVPLMVPRRIRAIPGLVNSRPGCFPDVTWIVVSPRSAL
jgi:hypothetical protein